MTFIKKVMDPYCDGLRKGIEDENWHLSLMAALILPEICITIENGKTNKHLYVEWFEKNVTDFRHQRNYIEKKILLEKMLKSLPTQDLDFYSENNPKLSKIVYFTGVNAYALRCSFLHNGSGHIGKQSIYKGRDEKETLGINQVEFDMSNENLVASIRNEVIVLNPKQYSIAILEAVYRWIDENENSKSLQQNASKLIRFT